MLANKFEFKLDIDKRLPSEIIYDEINKSYLNSNEYIISKASENIDNTYNVNEKPIISYIGRRTLFATLLASESRIL